MTMVQVHQWDPKFSRILMWTAVISAAAQIIGLYGLTGFALFSGLVDVAIMVVLASMAHRMARLEEQVLADDQEIDRLLSEVMDREDKTT